MKKLLVFAVALGFFACVPASAQNNGHHGDKHSAAKSDTTPASNSAGMRQNNQGRAMSGAAHMRAVDTVQPNASGRTAGMARSMRQNTPSSTTTENRFLPATGVARAVQSGRSVTNRTRNNSGWSGNTQPSAAVLPAANRSRSNSGWSGNTATRQTSVNSLRLNVQASRRFHGGNYLQPAGYQSRHWGYGQRLPRTYFVRDYWITDFLMFGLFAPPPDLIWVRVGDDALLVDRYSGDIVQVDYGVFY